VTPNTALRPGSERLCDRLAIVPGSGVDHQARLGAHRILEIEEARGQEAVQLIAGDRSRQGGLVENLARHTSGTVIVQDDHVRNQGPHLLPVAAHLGPDDRARHGRNSLRRRQFGAWRDGTRWAQEKEQRDDTRHEGR
jgi:hypothetical protein